jgi:hypothetical protein
MVHPETKDIYITDAGDYINPGFLYRFNREGKKQWSIQTGDIPAHFALLPKRRSQKIKPSYASHHKTKTVDSIMPSSLYTVAGRL